MIILFWPLHNWLEKLIALVHFFCSTWKWVEAGIMTVQPAFPLINYWKIWPKIAIQKQFHFKQKSSVLNGKQWRWWRLSGNWTESQLINHQFGAVIMTVLPEWTMVLWNGAWLYGLSDLCVISCTAVWLITLWLA